MNYKRRHRNTHKRLQAKQRRSKKTTTWTYGQAIAKEIVERREFRNLDI